MKSGMTSIGKSKYGVNSISPEYRVWGGMIRRCHSDKDPAYIGNNSRGITVCDRWRQSIDNFVEDMGNRPSAEHMLSRKDFSKGYYKDNCKWMLRIECPSNFALKTKTHSAFGEQKTLKEWVKDSRCSSGISSTILAGRLSNGWTMEKALSTSLRHKRASSTTEISEEVLSALDNDKLNNIAFTVSGEEFNTLMSDPTFTKLYFDKKVKMVIEGSKVTFPFSLTSAEFLKMMSVELFSRIYIKNNPYLLECCDIKFNVNKYVEYSKNVSNGFSSTEHRSIRDSITNALSKYGAEGCELGTLCDTINMKKANVYAWFYANLGRVSGLKKVRPGIYSYVPTTESVSVTA